MAEAFYDHFVREKYEVLRSETKILNWDRTRNESWSMLEDEKWMTDGKKGALWGLIIFIHRSEREQPIDQQLIAAPFLSPLLPPTPPTPPFSKWRRITSHWIAHRSQFSHSTFLIFCFLRSMSVTNQFKSIKFDAVTTLKFDCSRPATHPIASQAIKIKNRRLITVRADPTSYRLWGCGVR